MSHMRKQDNRRNWLFVGFSKGACATISNEATNISVFLIFVNRHRFDEMTSETSNKNVPLNIKTDIETNVSHIK